MGKNNINDIIGSLEDPTMAALYRVSGGTPGGGVAISELCKAALAQRELMTEQERAIFGILKENVSPISHVIYMLDELGIEGENLWICYKDICKQNAEYFLLRLQNGKIADDLVALPYVSYTKPTTEGTK